MKLLGALAVACVVSAVPASASAVDTPLPAPLPPAAITSPAWLVLQLIPSSELVLWSGAAHYGARWQITPLLYSFHGNRNLRPWRSFAVEPALRVSGSVELYVSPEALTGTLPRAATPLILRSGVRSYFPLLERGEQLALSLGASAFDVTGLFKVGAAADVGLHTFGGIFGARLGYSPTPGLRMTTLSAELRVF